MVGIDTDNRIDGRCSMSKDSGTAKIEPMAEVKMGHVTARFTTKALEDLYYLKDFVDLIIPKYSRCFENLPGLKEAAIEMVQELIAQNARVAQNQDDYNAAYDAAVSCYEATKAERERWLPTSVSAASAGGNSSGLSRNWKSCPRQFRNSTKRSGAAWWSM